MSEEKKKPKFYIEFNSFASYGDNRVEAALIVSPEFDIGAVISMLHSPDSARLITLVFNRKKREYGRRGYSLSKEWEQKPNGFQLSESEKVNE